MIATIKVKDKYFETEIVRDCYAFYCKCLRNNDHITYYILGKYLSGMFEETALIDLFIEDANIAMDELDRLNKLLDEAREQIDKQEGGSL